MIAQSGLGKSKAGLLRHRIPLQHTDGIPASSKALSYLHRIHDATVKPQSGVRGTGRIGDMFVSTLRTASRTQLRPCVAIVAPSDDALGCPANALIQGHTELMVGFVRPFSQSVRLFCTKQGCSCTAQILLQQDSVGPLAHQTMGASRGHWQPKSADGGNPQDPLRESRLYHNA